MRGVLKNGKSNVFGSNCTNKRDRFPAVGKKRSLSEALDTKCTLEPPLKKTHTLPISVIELRSQHKGELRHVKSGMHPALAKADQQNRQLSKKIKRIEEMAQFWKRKSLTLAEDLDRSRTEISMLRNKLENVEAERLQLQSKLLSAKQDSTQCVKAIESLMSENENLKFIVNNVNKELQLTQESKAEFEEKCDVSMVDMDDEVVDMETCKELEEALEDTLADLTERIEEIEELKAALAKTTVERDALQRVVSREVIESAIASLDNRELETNPTKLRIQKLQEMVEKCMFRIAVLTQKNEELKKITIDGSEDTNLLETLEDSQKLEVLESLCMQRYRKLLRNTAANLVESGEDEDLANESFLDVNECLANGEANI